MLQPESSCESWKYTHTHPCSETHNSSANKMLLHLLSGGNFRVRFPRDELRLRISAPAHSASRGPVPALEELEETFELWQRSLSEGPSSAFMIIERRGSLLAKQSV